MKKLIEIISEKLILKKTKQISHNYTPNTITELREIITDKIENLNSDETILDLRDIDVSNLKTLESMTIVQLGPTNREKIKNIDTIDVSGWDVSNVTNFRKAFCSIFVKEHIETIIGLDTWDVSNGTTFREFFSDAEKLQNIDGVENFSFGSDCSDISYFFANCKSLDDINVSNWNTKSVYWCGGVFYNCENITSMDLSNWDNSTLYGCVSLFKGCSRLQTVYGLNNFNISRAKDTSRMFEGCANLYKVEGIEQYTIMQTLSIESMFDNCGKLKANLSGWKLNKHCITKAAFRYTSRKLLQKPKGL
jgi:surface protein